jgi:hypothetical protein
MRTQQARAHEEEWTVLAKSRRWLTSQAEVQENLVIGRSRMMVTVTPVGIMEEHSGYALSSLVWRFEPKTHRWMVFGFGASKSS